MHVGASRDGNNVVLRWLAILTIVVGDITNENWDREMRTCMKRTPQQAITVRSFTERAGGSPLL